MTLSQMLGATLAAFFLTALLLWALPAAALWRAVGGQ